MPEQTPLRALTCPNCSAPLEFPEARASLRCRFCGSVIERSEEAPTHDDLGRAMPVDISGGQMNVTRRRVTGSGSGHYVIKMQDGRPLVIELPGEAAAQPAPAPRPGAAPAAVPAGRPARRGSGLGCAIGLLVIILGITIVSTVVAVGGTTLLAPLLAILAMSHDSRDGSAPPSGISQWVTQVPGLSGALTQVPAASARFLVSGSAALVPAVSDAPADIIALASRYDLSGGEGAQLVISLSGARPGLQWMSDPIDKDTYSAPIAAGRDFVYLVSGTKLMALRRADGQSAWTVSLADKLSPSLCRNCLALSEGRLFVLTDDGTLQALDAASGTPEWKFRSVQDTPRGLYLLAGRPAFLDNDDQGNGLLRAFDPATGDMQTVQPGCATNFAAPDYPSWTNHLALAPDGASAYLAFGFFRKCVARIDAASLEVTWSARLPEDLPSFDADTPPVFGPQAMYFGAGEAILRVNLADGLAQVLAGTPDYSVTPLAATDDLLLVSAERQRGSHQFELQALDPATGEQRWTYSLDQSPPLGDNPSIIDEDKPVWTWHLSDAGVTVLRFKRAADDVSHAVLLDTIDPATGVAGAQRQIPLGVETIILSSPKLLGWQRDTLWFVIENKAMALDTAQGAIVYRWP